MPISYRRLRGGGRILAIPDKLKLFGQKTIKIQVIVSEQVENLGYNEGVKRAESGTLRLTRGGTGTL